MNNEIYTHYSDEIASENLKLVIDADWSSNEKVAHIKIPNGRATLSISGAMARINLMTEDAYLLILCHEIGHVLGGAPKMSPGHWSSTEGQADYFSTAKCFKKIIKENTKDRAQKASLILAQITAEGQGTDIHSISLAEHDDSEVLATSTIHTSAQCRLDTMIAGLNCPIDEEVSFSSSDLTQGACLESDVRDEYRNSARPRCWYRPATPMWRCTSEEKFSEFGGQISLLTFTMGKKRDDHTIQVQLNVSLFNPKTNSVIWAQSDEDLNSIYSSEFEITKQSQKSFQLAVKKTLVQKMQQNSLVPISWDNVQWNEDSSGNYLFQMSCSQY